MFASSDYDGETFESIEAQRREEEEIHIEEAEEQLAREMAFNEKPSCDEECLNTAIHSAKCTAAVPSLIAAPIAAGVNGWLLAMRAEMAAGRYVVPATAPRFAEIGNGVFVRVGTGRKRRAA